MSRRLLLVGNDKWDSRGIGGIWTDQHINWARLDYSLHFGIQDGQLFWTNLESDVGGSTGFQVNVFEAAQHFYRLNHAA
jgi:hypothetical protein